MNEKYCHYCENQGFCAIYTHIHAISVMLINNLAENPIKENGYQIIINEVAHNCKQFKKFKE